MAGNSCCGGERETAREGTRLEQFNGRASPSPVSGSECCNNSFNYVKHPLKESKPSLGPFQLYEIVIV